jgi:hypothetical protein
MSMTDKRDIPESNPDMASMPRLAMPGASPDRPNAGMPNPTMQAESGAELPRFPSPSQGPIEARYEPGVVEVQFRQGLMPRVIPGGPGQPPSLAAGVPLDDVNVLLRRYQAISAEATGSDLVTLHFPADANVLEIAGQLNQLGDVERAAPVPSALPPGGMMAPPR